MGVSSTSAQALVQISQVTCLKVILLTKRRRQRSIQNLSTAFTVFLHRIVHCEASYPQDVVLAEIFKTTCCALSIDHRPITAIHFATGQAETDHTVLLVVTQANGKQHALRANTHYTTYSARTGATTLHIVCPQGLRCIQTTAGIQIPAPIRRIRFR